MRNCLPLIALSFLLAGSALADSKLIPESSVIADVARLQKQIDQLTKLVTDQQAKIQLMEESRTRQTEQPTTVATVKADQIRPSGSYVPDIGIVADIVGSASQSDSTEEGNDRLSVREVEIVFGHDIDPYSRMDVVATFSDSEDPDIEEANITYFGLPAGIKARIGRMRQRIGKASAAHRDTLETVDEPFVVQRYLGKEGLFKTGLELSAFAPFDYENATQEWVAGIMEGGVGEDGELFGEVRRHPTGYLHTANFFELSDATSTELGLTYLLGSQSEESGADVQAFGVDATLSRFFSSTNKLKIQGEGYFQRRSKDSFTNADGERLQSDHSPFGAYLLADYRLSERWGAGARYDYVQPTFEVDGERASERGYTGYLTFFQSEFARWRFQYQRADLLDGSSDNRFLLQGTFAIGAHKHNIN